MTVYIIVIRDSRRYQAAFQVVAEAITYCTNIGPGDEDYLDLNGQSYFQILEVEV